MKDALLGIGGAFMKVEELDDGFLCDGVDVAGMFLGDAYGACEVGEVGRSLGAEKGEGDLRGQACFDKVKDAFAELLSLLL